LSLRTKFQGLREVWRFDNRWSLLLGLTLSRRVRLKTYRLKGVEILMDHGAGDAAAVRRILFSSEYRSLLGAMKLEKPVRVLDIGANAGGFALLFPILEIPLEKIVCVELNPATTARLRVNLGKNIPTVAAAVNAALQGRAGTVSVNLGAGFSGDSIYHASGGQPCQVPGLTFDELYEAHFGEEPVDICKIDVEGAEAEVLESGTCRRLALCRNLIIEIHPHAWLAETRARLDMAGAVALIEDHGLKKTRQSQPGVFWFRKETP